MASLEDVAAHAKVSVATASRVLNGSRHPVSDATKAKVHASAAELGYSPSAVAQALANKQSRIIGVIVEDSADPYFAEITRGVEDVASRAGYLTIVCNADRKIDVEVEQMTLMRHYSAAGVIFAGSGFIGGDHARLAGLVKAARDDGITVVSLGRREIEADVVTYDNEAAAHDLTVSLIASAHKRIVLVGGLPGVYAAEDRKLGYLRAMDEAGLAPEVIPGTFGPESGSSAALRLLVGGSLPDAVIGSNDQTAGGILTAFRQADIKVPEQVAVAGIGGTRLAALLDMTTAAVPLHTLGATAAHRILHPERSREPIILPHQIVPRGTTAHAGYASL
ncbi:LacI family DNA-binding transcriptional regulator [Nocardioides gansuensis]|nr:LacI family DNA-binding transcriptional regulator [Nocardioides gansuensis]